MCKRKGYSYELKEIIELQSYKMSDDLMNNRDMKKVRSQGDGGDRTTTLLSPVIGIMIHTIILIDALERRDLVDGNFRSATHQ